MSTINLAGSLSHGPGAPRRPVATRPFLFLLTSLLITALVALVLPKGDAKAQNVGAVLDAKETYFTENGRCYVETVAATGLDGVGAERFVESMNFLVSKLGHDSNFTFNNGTVTTTATVDCPTSGPSVETIIFENWVKPAVGVAGGLILVIASALGITAIYERISNDTIDQEGRLAKSITSLGGFLSTALLTYLASNGNWQSTLSSAITAVFTTYLVTAYGFDGLQKALNIWVSSTFGFAASLAVDGVARAKDGINALRTDTIQTVAQVRA